MNKVTSIAALIAGFAILGTVGITTAYAEQDSTVYNLVFSATIDGQKNDRTLLVQGQVIKANDNEDDGQVNLDYNFINGTMSIFNLDTGELRKQFNIDSTHSEIDIDFNDDGTIRDLDLIVYTHGKKSVHYKELRVDYDPNIVTNGWEYDPDSSSLATIVKDDGTSTLGKEFSLFDPVLIVIDSTTNTEELSIP